MNRTPRSIAAAACIPFCLLGCVGKTPPSRFYTVPALVAPERVRPDAPGAMDEVVVAVGPIQIPKYLDRPQIVTSSTGTVVTYSEYDRWAAPLDANLQSVLDRNLSTLLGTSRIIRFPWVGVIPADYWVPVEIARLDVAPDGGVILGARWSVHGSEPKELYVVRATRAVAEASSVSVSGTVEAIGKAVEQLSREIAEEIVRIRESGVEPILLDDDGENLPGTRTPGEGPVAAPSAGGETPY